MRHGRGVFDKLEGVWKYGHSLGNSILNILLLTELYVTLRKKLISNKILKIRTLPCSWLHLFISFMNKNKLEKYAAFMLD